MNIYRFRTARLIAFVAIALLTGVILMRAVLERDVIGSGGSPPVANSADSVGAKATSDPVKTEATSDPVETEATSAPVETEATTDSVETEATSDPVETEATSDPVETEATTDPVKTEATTDSVETEATTDPVKTEATSDPVETEATSAPVETEATTDSVETEATSDPVKTEATSDPVETEATTDPVKTEATTEPVETEATTDPIKAEATRDPVETEATTDSVETEATTDPVETEATTDPVKTEATTEPVETEATTDSQPQHHVPAMSRPSRFGQAGPSPPPVTDSAMASAATGVYPALTVAGKFIPPARVVHFDLKGAPPQVAYIEKMFALIASPELAATGVLLEWEDMFPYTGELKRTRNAYAYSPEDIRAILTAAKRYNLEVIPLVQTFGHLEWILKHPEFDKLREVDRYPQVVCLSNPEAVQLVLELIDQVVKIHGEFEFRFFHIGADEAFQVGQCQRCQREMREKHQGNKERLMLRHITTVAAHLRDKHGKRALMWHDMLNNVDVRLMQEFKLGELVEPVVWAYAEDLNSYLMPHMWARFSQVFSYIWGASAFKGADGPTRWWSNVPHYLANHVSWVTQMTREYKNFREFRGLFLTGWQRFDHFAVLCELFPVGIPSLAVNLIVIRAGVYDRAKTGAVAAAALKCSNVFDVESQGVAGFCNFAGYKIYQLIQQLKMTRSTIHDQLFDDYQIRGWLSDFNIAHNYSSAWYLDQVVPKVTMYHNELNSLVRQLRAEIATVFYGDVADEFIFEYIREDMEKLERMANAGRAMATIHNFPVRPFPIKGAVGTTKTAGTNGRRVEEERKPTRERETV